MAIIRVFENTDMRKGKDGLILDMRKKRVAASALREPDFVLFLNRRRTHFKLMFGGDYVMAYKSPKGRITMAAIEKIPTFFKGPIVQAAVIREKLGELLCLKESTVIDDSGRKAV